MFEIDVQRRKVIVTQDVTRITKEISEGDEVKRKFAEGTKDIFRCFLKLIEVDIVDGKTGNVTGKETKAFAIRENREDWIMNFNEEDYILFE